MFTIAVLPIFGVSGLQVFAAEASGPTHDKVHPRIGITAKMDMEHLCRSLTLILVVLVNAGRHELVRQRMPCLCHYRNGWFLHQAGKRSLLQLSSLYRICHLCLHVHFRYQFYIAATLSSTGSSKVIDNAELKWYSGR